MIARQFDGLIDETPFNVWIFGSVRDEGENWSFPCVPLWGDDHKLNTEQEADVLGSIAQVLATERDQRILTFNNPAPYTPKFTGEGVCGECGSKRAPAYFIACADCHHMIDPATDAEHMCVERTYRLQTAVPQHAQSAA